MGKFITSSKVITSEDQTPSEKTILTYYCSICHTLALIMDADFKNLKVRCTDGAAIIDRGTTMCNVTAKQDPVPVYIKRPNGLERQYRFNCKNCEVQLFYASEKEKPPTPPDASGAEATSPSNADMLYIFPDAVTSMASKGGAAGKEVPYGRTEHGDAASEERAMDEKAAADSYASNAAYVYKKIGPGVTVSSEATKKKRGTLLGD